LEQYVWDLRYVDASVLRFQDTDSDGTVDNTLYYTNDANFNVTALVDESGTVVERYAYDPYGERTVLDADWSTDADNASDVNNEVLYAGYRFDPETGLFHVRNRMYHPTLGRWVQPDPDGFINGLNLYAYVTNGPISARDPAGLVKWVDAPKDGACCGCDTEKGNCVVRLHEYPKINGIQVVLDTVFGDMSVTLQADGLDKAVGKALSNLAKKSVKSLLGSIIGKGLAGKVIGGPSAKAKLMIQAALPTLQMTRLMVEGIRIDGVYVDSSYSGWDAEVEYETITCEQSFWDWFGEDDCYWYGWDDEDWEDNIHVTLGEATSQSAGGWDWAWEDRVFKVAEKAFKQAKKRFVTLQKNPKDRAKAVLTVLAHKLGCDADKALIGDD
jgi:RHS repeat-associated protein